MKKQFWLCSEPLQFNKSCTGVFLVARLTKADKLQLHGLLLRIIRDGMPVGQVTELTAETAAGVEERMENLAKEREIKKNGLYNRSNNSSNEAAIK